MLQQTVAESNTLGYVIGGFVRDHLLNRSHKKDIDIVALDSGIDLAIAVQNKLKGAKAVQVFKTYGTAMVHWNNTDLEFVGARKESYSKESRNPEVKPGTLEDDQNRRDFTINALAISLNKDDFGLLIDPFNGLKDLEEGVLRTPLDPDITYSDDPLRMLRAIRFATQLDFTIASDSYDSISRNAERIDIITKERIVEELNKILMTPKPSKGFILLEKTGLLQRILPELIDLKGVEEIEGQKHKDNFYHTLEVVDNLCKNSDDLWLRWAALLHDIGKAPTKKFKPPVGWTFHNHEFVGAKMTYNLFKRMKMPLNEKMKFVQKMVFMSSRPIIIAEEQVTDSAIRRLVFDAGPFIDDLITLCEADITTKNPERFERYHNNFKIVREKIILVEEKDHLRNFQPPISGETIMKYFDLKPSKEIGLIKEAIKEAILEGEIPNEREAALKKMKSEGKKLGLTFHEKAI
ncbi:CCA tRNA nucleotidyltransferase [Flavobacteriaceae bacterium]|nr:CCA tRNA nucleotidyltransferase [Flavobacteriaceae bacterium]MDA7820523.1 CCA tRNA nucleotidyltransferase [Flavobacteriaceae bacterium]MDA9305898.1 CCA tRNA nucleotidyltransferase [Flavobacteriaceae bacterium]MDA9327243.1 CCA tRNA nucleotidyltransferase [Flavobacteriaceae bacterium]MDA9576885.1 CCA tRNA nucleotidyltransferase [Flavobacteriaceae bacterium]